MNLFRVSLLSLALLAPAVRVLAADPVLKIVSPDKTLTLTATEFAALPHTDVKLADEHDSTKERSFSGVPMRELLLKAGAPLGDKFRGKALAMGVVMRCKDGYSVLFALAEFDENFSTRTLLLADQENGEMLPPSAAPFRLVVPGDKRGARAAHQVVAIELVSLSAKP